MMVSFIFDIGGGGLGSWIRILHFGHVIVFGFAFSTDTDGDSLIWISEPELDSFYSTMKLSLLN